MFTEQIKLDQRSVVPLVVQLSQQLTWLIASGHIEVGEKLPPVRELADQLSINMHTARAAYQQLEAEGLVSMRQGRGTIVQPLDLRRLAERLPGMRSFVVGIIIPGFNPFYNPFLKGIEAAARDDPTLFFICSTHDSPQAASGYLHQLIARNVEGIIVTGTDLDHDPLIEDQLSQPDALLPIVYTDVPGFPGCHLLFDLEGGGYQAARHLVEHGHERIGLITPSTEWPNVGQVFAGYRRAVGTVRENLIAVVEGFTLEAGIQGCVRLLDQPDRPSAILAADDNLAIGTIQAIKGRGLDVPGDIAVVGINDMDLAAVVDPSLTTVALPARDMGFRAMKMLNWLIAGEPLEETQVVLPTQLVIRQSCGCG